MDAQTHVGAALAPNWCWKMAVLIWRAGVASRLYNFFYRFSGLSKLFFHHPHFGRYNMTFVDPDVEIEVDFGGGCVHAGSARGDCRCRPVR